MKTMYFLVSEHVTFFLSVIRSNVESLCFLSLLSHIKSEQVKRFRVRLVAAILQPAEACKTTETCYRTTEGGKRLSWRDIIFFTRMCCFGFMGSHSRVKDSEHSSFDTFQGKQEVFNNNKTQCFKEVIKGSVSVCSLPASPSRKNKL